VQVPPALTLTPVGAAPNAQQAPLTCTTTSATTVQVTTAAGAGAAGQVYTCTVTVGTSAPAVSRVPMTLTATGPATVGRPDTVMLAAPAGALGSAFPVSAAPMFVSGAADLEGGDRTDAGTVPMTGLADTERARHAARPGRRRLDPGTAAGQPQPDGLV